MTVGILFLIGIGVIGIASAMRLTRIEREFFEKFGVALRINPIKGWTLPSNFDPTEDAKTFLDNKKRGVSRFNFLAVSGLLVLFGAWLIVVNFYPQQRVGRNRR